MKITIVVIAIVYVFAFIRKGKRDLNQGVRKISSDWDKKPKRPFPQKWRAYLESDFPFYQKLNPSEKDEFVRRLHLFLLNIRISGLHGAKVTDYDRVIIGASAIMMLFRFPNWQFRFLHHIQVTPKSFLIAQGDKLADGITGEGRMLGRMVLSQEAIHRGIKDQEDGKNVVVHELMHILDRQDGKTDGVPKALLTETTVGPWLEIMRKKMLEMKQGSSDLDRYGLSHPREFFSVAAEYFFEKPEEMEEKHPDLYKVMCEMFRAG